MTNTRPLEDAERNIANLTRDISETAHLFRDVDPEVARVIRRAHSEAIGSLRAHTDANDEGDRELLRAYGAYLAEVAKALQSL